MPQDFEAFSALAKRILSAQRDNVDIQQTLNQSYSFKNYECVGDIDNNLDQLGSEISFLSTLISISSAMESTYDERVINDNLAIEVRSTLKLLPLARRSINNSAAYCGSSAIVVSRAQVASSLLDQSEDLLLRLNQRL